MITRSNCDEATLLQPQSEHYIESNQSHVDLNLLWHKTPGEEAVTLWHIRLVILDFRLRE